MRRRILIMVLCSLVRAVGTSATAQAADAIPPWRTGMGGVTHDWANAVTPAAAGTVLVAGLSNDSWGNPIRPHEDAAGVKVGAHDCFVAKLGPGGTLIWNTFLGAEMEDECAAIARDAAGNVYVTGWSRRTWGAPLLDFAADPGGTAAFVAKLDSDGNLVWNTFIGGLHARGYGIAVDPTGNVHVTGTGGDTWGSPVRPFGYYVDAFVARFDGNGALVWNTFLGQSTRKTALGFNSNDEGLAIALDGSGNVLVTGYSNGTWGEPVHPWTGGLAPTGLNFRLQEVFLAKLDPSGNLVWNTFHGDPTLQDIGKGIAVDAQGNPVVTGWKAIFEGDQWHVDSFLAGFDADGNLAWETGYGSPENLEFANSVAIGGHGGVFVAGERRSGFGDPFAFRRNPFVARFDRDGGLVTEVFPPWRDRDGAFGIAVDEDDNVLIVGEQAHATPPGTVDPDRDAFVQNLGTIPIPLGVALDADKSWKSGPSGPWRGQDAVTHDGRDAARSGSVAGGAASVLRLPVTGPALVSFWWMTSSGPGDRLAVSVDGRVRAARSGQGGWEFKTLRIGRGRHVVRWTYRRGSTAADGMNAGFLDQVTVKRR